jgi:ferredoxin
MTTAQRVWIEDGCIQCFWCHHLVPEVFVCGAQGTRVDGRVRVDQRTSDNRRERSPLTTVAMAALDLPFVQFVADGCPAKVIVVDPPGVVG